MWVSYFFRSIWNTEHHWTISGLKGLSEWFQTSVPVRVYRWKKQLGESYTVNWVVGFVASSVSLFSNGSCQDQPHRTSPKPSSKQLPHRTARRGLARDGSLELAATRRASTCPPRIFGWPAFGPSAGVTQASGCVGIDLRSSFQSGSGCSLR